jgi:hypothetical protein
MELTVDIREIPFLPDDDKQNPDHRDPIEFSLKAKRARYRTPGTMRHSAFEGSLDRNREHRGPPPRAE